MTSRGANQSERVREGFRWAARWFWRHQWGAFVTWGSLCTLGIAVTRVIGAWRAGLWLAMAVSMALGVCYLAAAACAIQRRRCAFAGLGGDIAIDAVKGESIGDEGTNGYINPLHSYLPSGLRGPQIYLPGVHCNGSVDVAW